MKCPRCGEANEAGMQFCINCGQSLAPAPTGTAAQSSNLTIEQSAMVANSGGTMVLFCPTCNKADPLNGQFCVYCAGRTISMPGAPAAGPLPAAQSPLSLAQNAAPSINPDLRMSSDSLAQYKITTGLQRKGPNNVLRIFTAAILGSVLAGAATFAAKDEIQKSALSSSWPAEGVLVFTNNPNVNVKLESAKKDSFILGKTSSDGSFHIANISPGNYLLSIFDNTHSLGKMFVAKRNEANVIGYPEKLKLE